MSNTNNNMQTQKSNSLHNIIEAAGKDRQPMLAPECSLETTTEGYMENYKNVLEDIRKQLDAKAESIHIILTGIDNDIYSIVFLSKCNGDVESNSKFGKFTSRDGESPELYYSRFYKMMNKLVRNQCDVTNNQINVQFLLQLQPKCKATNRNRGKAIVNSPQPTYDQAPAMVAEDNEMFKEKENDKLMALIYLSFKKVQHNNDYNVFANDTQHPKQPESINDTYPDEQGDNHNIIDSLDMSYNGENVDQDDDLAKERDLLVSLIEKLKCEIDDSKNHNKLLESANKTLVDKLKSEIEDFKNKNKHLESSNTHFKEANTELSKTNQLMFKDLKKFQAELDKYHDVNYTSKVEIEYAKAKGE
ncbi:hypothetical protein Tco_0164435 [Tanacetum coccineum]